MRGAGRAQNRAVLDGRIERRIRPPVNPVLRVIAVRPRSQPGKGAVVVIQIHGHGCAELLEVVDALRLPGVSVGRSIAARIPITAITTSSSTSVKPPFANPAFLLISGFILSFPSASSAGSPSGINRFNRECGRGARKVSPDFE